MKEVSYWMKGPWCKNHSDIERRAKAIIFRDAKGNARYRYLVEGLIEWDMRDCKALRVAPRIK